MADLQLSYNSKILIFVCFFKSKGNVINSGMLTYFPKMNC